MQAAHTPVLIYRTTVLCDQPAGYIRDVAACQDQRWLCSQITLHLAALPSSVLSNKSRNRGGQRSEKVVSEKEREKGASPFKDR